MKKTTLIGILLFMVISGRAQTFQWLRTPPINLSLSADLIGYCSAVDALGNTYITGFKDGAAAYSDVVGNIMYAKFNDAGELQFINAFSGHGIVYGIASCPDGGMVLSIGYTDTLTIGNLTLNNGNGGMKYVLVKFDASGNLLWHWKPQYNGNEATQFRAVASDSDGNVYAGFDLPLVNYITKMDGNGNILFTISNTNMALLSSIAVDTQGNIYAAGSCADPDAAFAGVVVPTTFNYNAWITKYSPAGTHQWTRYVNDITCYRPEVRVNTPDQVYLGSYLFGSYAFGNTTSEGPTAGSFNDFYITRLDASGNFLWMREVPGAGIAYLGKRNFMAVGNNGNVYFAGSSRSTINWGNGVVTTNPASSSDGMVLAFNANGVAIMGKTAGGISEDRFDGVSVNNAGDIFVSGMGRGNTAFGAIQNISEGNAAYPFITKINSSILAVGPAIPEKVLLYPNPASDYLYVSGVSKCNGTIYNVLGQKTRDFEITPTQPLDVRGLSKGTYLVKAEGLKTIKFIKI